MWRSAEESRVSSRSSRSRKSSTSSPGIISDTSDNSDVGFSEWDDISQVQYDTGAAAAVQVPSDSLNSVTFSNVTEQVVPVDVINDLLHTAIGGNSALENMVRKLKIEATQRRKLRRTSSRSKSSSSPTRTSSSPTSTTN